SGKVVLDREGAWPVFSPDDRLLAFIDKANRVVVLDLATGQVVQTLTPRAGAKSSDAPYLIPRGLAGGRLILQGEHVSVWDVRTGKQLASWGLADAGVLPKQKPDPQSWERLEAVAVSGDGKKVAFALLKDLPRRGSRGWFGRVMVFATAGQLLHQLDLA